MAETITMRHLGRGGNNIIQNINAIGYARHFGHRVRTLQVRPFFDELDFDFSGGKARGQRRINAFTMATPQVQNFALLPDEMAGVAKEFLSERLLVQPVLASDRTLTIHLRSGDIMDAAHPANASRRVNPNYVQPPMALYRRIMKDEAFDNIVVVAEPDGESPCLRPLCEEFHAEVVDGPEDVAYAHLLGACHLCFGMSTFAASAALLSLSLKSLFIGEGYHNPFRPNKIVPTFVKTTVYNYKGYIKMRDWTASPEQKRLMTELPTENCKKSNE